MEDRATEVAKYAVAYPAGVVAVVVVGGVVAGVRATASGFMVTVVAAVVGLVALHDPQSPRRRAHDSVRDDENEGEEIDPSNPAASLAGHGRADDPDDRAAVGAFDERSWHLLLFATGLFVLGWVAVLLAA